MGEGGRRYPRFGRERERETGGRLQSCELKIQRRTGGVEKGGGGRSAEEGWI